MASLLDEAIKVGRELEGAEGRKTALQAQIEAKQAELKQVTLDAEQAGRVMLDDATQQARLILQQAEQTQQIVRAATARLDAQTKALCAIDGALGIGGAR